MQSEIEKYVPTKKKNIKKSPPKPTVLASESFKTDHQSKSIEIMTIEVEKIIDKEGAEPFGLIQDIQDIQIVPKSIGENHSNSNSNSENEVEVEVEVENDSDATMPDIIPKATVLEKSGDGYAIRSVEDFDQIAEQDSNIMPIKSDLQTLYTFAWRVFQQLGPGHTENIYHKALELELRLHGVVYESEKRVLITYESLVQPGKFFTLGEERIDLFLVDLQLIIELKATSTEPRQPELAQIVKYYRELCKVVSPEEVDKLATVGVIINFPQPGPNKKGRSEIDFALIHLAE